MKSLIDRCKNERYYQTIKFFYHRLSADKKPDFILQVAEANILLASQCLMSDSRDDELEARVLVQAIDAAQTFRDTPKSTAGLLALAEFQQYDLILEIFNSIEKPSRIHLLVVSQVFREADEETYIKFIQTFTAYEQIGLLLTTFMTYKGRVPITTESITVLNNLLMCLINKGYSGFVRAYLTAYELWQSVELIFGTQLENLINTLIKGKERDITLAFYLVDACEKREKYPPSIFITALSAHKSNKKALGLATQIAVQYSIFDNKDLNSNLSRILGQSMITRKRGKLARYLLKKGLKSYASTDSQLNQKIESLSIPTEEKKIPQIKHLRNFLPFQMFLGDVAKENSLLALQTIFGEIIPEDFRQKCTLIDFWRIVFDYILASEKKLILEEIIEECARIYMTDYKTICSVLTNYIHTGMVQQVESYGFYVYPFTFSSANLCFLHLNSFGKPAKKQQQKPIELGQPIAFSINGYNPEKQRIKIHAVNKFL